MKFVFVLLSLFFSFASAQDPQSVPQRPTDTPKDQAIQIKIHDGRTYCYSPNFTKGFGYVLLSDCNYASPARYDVFQRISWKINGAWMCLSAPSSITGIDGKSTQQWDWLLVEPCSLNDANQRWIIKDNSLYTADGRFKVKDYQWYAFISKNKDDYYDHTLNMGAMQTWINTVATPGNISLRTFVGWVFVAQTPPQFAVYYIQNNQSFKDDVKQLFYNPENGHIAQFDYANGKLYCMTSKQSKRDDWNWIAWELCDDNIPKAKTAQSWEFFALNDNEGTLRDKDGNFLRVTQYGPNWGVPYTAKPEYLEKDTTNSPKSFFVFDKFVDRWDRYVNANLGDSLFYCPAPGGKTTLLASDGANNVPSEESKTRTIRSLPPTFQVTEDWIRRFWEIATTTTVDPQQITILGPQCGICLLHAYQMIAELQEYHLTRPPHVGGYFFDTAPNTDISPFNSLINRFPALAQRIESISFVQRMSWSYGDTIDRIESRMLYTATLFMLPNYNFYTAPVAFGEIGIRNAIRELLARPVGTMWVAGIIRTPASGQGEVGHAQPILRVPGGLMFIPTNVYRTTLDQYRARLLSSIARDEVEAMNIITIDRTRAAIRLYTMEVLGPQPAPINFYISNNNCTGLGEDRRGTTRYPLSATINQCASGRCGM